MQRVERCHLKVGTSKNNKKELKTGCKGKVNTHVKGLGMIIDKYYQYQSVCRLTSQS